MSAVGRVDTRLVIAPPTPDVVLSVRDLRVSYVTRGQRVPALHGISFDVRAGETIALVGESGSGKTTTGQAVIGLLPRNARIDGGLVELERGLLLDGRPQRRRGAGSEHTLDAVRGRRIALVPQDPTVSLDPLLRIGVQVAEVFRLHNTVPRDQRRARVLELLDRVGLADAARRIDSYPHELSGGQRQRVLIAIAIAASPAVIIADEPTSGLDVTVQRRILDLLDDLQRELGTAIVHVTHDLAVAADRSDTVAVLRGGRIEEIAPTARVVSAPESDYARLLLASVPHNVASTRQPVAIPNRITGPDPAADGEHAGQAEPMPVLEARSLVYEFPTPAGPFRAVDDVSFAVPARSTVSIVGESGSGKSTTVRLLAHLIRPASGQLLLHGRDVTASRERKFRPERRHLQVVYQNPFASLDPRQTVEQVIAEPLRALSAAGRAERHRLVLEMLDAVALPADHARRLPRELSGGQRQRVAIARALVLRPEVVVLDEPVSALDASVQGQVLDLLDDLQREFGTSYVFVSHDLAVVRRISDRVIVLRGGRVVDDAPTERLFTGDVSDYTRELREAVPGRGVGRRTGR